jgi:uncharacterized protein YbbK (DUF523 family)
MSAFAIQFLDSLPPVDGFILKGGSPTSGTSGVRVYPSAEKSMAIEKTAGFFAREVLKRFSELPIEDELHRKMHGSVTISLQGSLPLRHSGRLK